MTIDPKILNKIKKCLALAGSSNANEAATALRQAHALMAKYGIAAEDVAMAEIGESATPSRTIAREKPAQWEGWLVSIVAQAFSCEVMIQKRYSPHPKLKFEGQFVFVGLAHHAEVAAYTANVLVRKCKSARQKWISANLSGVAQSRPGGKRLMTQMGDRFAEGWVDAIAQQVRDFANPTPEIADAIARHVLNQTKGRSPAEVRATKTTGSGRLDALAWHSGIAAAAEEKLYRPMTGDGAPLALGDNAGGSA